MAAPQFTRCPETETHCARCEITLKVKLGVTMSQQNIFELLAAPYPAELSEAVNAKLAEGWKLFGHPFAHAGEFYQAVVGQVEVDKPLRKPTEDE